MAELSRKFLKIFGENNPLSQALVQYGSFAQNGSVTFSIDPEVMQALDAYLDGWIKASEYTGTQGAPGLEDFNALHYIFSYHLAYLYQSGIPEWNSQTEYFINSFARVNGTFYISLTDNNIGNDPVSSPTEWAPQTLDILDGSVTTAKLANFAVTTAKIANEAVTAEQLAIGAAVEAKIGDGAVTSFKLKNGAVGANKLGDTASYENLQTRQLQLVGSEFAFDPSSSFAYTTGANGETAILTATANPAQNAQTGLHLPVGSIITKLQFFIDTTGANDLSMSIHDGVVGGVLFQETFNNVSGLQVIDLEAGGGVTFDPSTAVHAPTQDLFVVSQDSFAESIAFRQSDGLKMFMLGGQFRIIRTYTLSIPFDPASGTHVPAEDLDVSSEDMEPRSLAFKQDDGLKLFIIGNINDTVFTYTLGTAWNPSTATHQAAQDLDVSSEDTGPQEIAFKQNDGLKMFMLGSVNGTVFTYTLGTAWNPSTATHQAAQDLDVSSEETDPTSLVFKQDDGLKLFIIGISSDAVRTYLLGLVQPIPITTEQAAYMDITTNSNGQTLKYALIDYTISKPLP